MSTKATDAEESTAVKPRLRRAVTECMTVVPEGGDVYTVSSASSREYAVDAREGRCTCPDAEHNLSGEELCKHALRVAIVRQERAIPAAVDRDAVDPLLGCAVDSTPVAVATDGGQIVVDLDDENDRPDDCGCWDVDAVLPCWPCARDGFDAPNPAAEGE